MHTNFTTALNYVKFRSLSSYKLWGFINDFAVCILVILVITNTLFIIYAWVDDKIGHYTDITITIWLSWTNKNPKNRPKQIITDRKYHSKPITVVIPQARKPTEKDINDRDNHLTSQQNRPHTKEAGRLWSVRFREL